MDRILFGKIKFAASWGWDSSKTARYFGISRYKVEYWLGKLKRFPSAYLDPKSGVSGDRSWKGRMHGMSNRVERVNILREAKQEFNKLIIFGVIDLDDPIGTAQFMRQKFERVYGCLPEHVK